MFGAPYRSALPGYALSLASGKFENSSPPGIAVADYDNSQVLLFHNNGANRTFTQSGTVFPGFRPVVVRFADFDNDNNLDLIVGGDTNEVAIFWGDGAGGFSSPSTVSTLGRVRSLEPVITGNAHSNTLWVTEDNGFVPNTGFLEDVVSVGGRALCHDALQKAVNLAYVPDTIPAVITALAVTHLDTLTPYQIAALGFNGTEKVGIYQPVEDLFGSACNIGSRLGFAGWDTLESFPTAAYLGFGSSIIHGDFDHDGNEDLLTTGESDNSCVLLRNHGSTSFTADTISTTGTRGLVALDYNNDNSLDFVTVDQTLDSVGITVFLNDGAGHFTGKRNCFLPFASGSPAGVIAADFDGDTKPDLAIISRSPGGLGHDSLFVLYNLGGLNNVTGVEARRGSELPDGYAVSQNYPNPFNPSTRIEYSLPVQSHVDITIYNILGQEITGLLSDVQEAGTHTLEWNGKSGEGTFVSSGVYFYRIFVRPLNGKQGFTSVKKMLMMR